MTDAALAIPPPFEHTADAATAQATATSKELSDLLEAIAGAIHTIEAANTGATAMTKLVQSALALIAQADDADIKAAAHDLAAALTRLGAQAQSLATELSRVQARQDFAIAMIGALPAGAESIARIARHQERANLLALQERQQRSTTALLLAAQASEPALRLFE